MGSTRLALDAGSFEIKRIEKFPAGPTPGVALAWFRDKAGDTIVSAFPGLGYDGQFTVQRTDNPERLWDELHQDGRKDFFADASKVLNDATPATMEGPQAQQDFTAAFEAWLEANFEPFRRERAYDYSFWNGINNYFYCCWHLKEYQKIVDLYQKIESDAWWNPYVFHHTACTYVALGKKNRAISEVRSALMYGYERIDDLLADPDIAPLFDRDDFQHLKAFRAQSKDWRKMLLPPELLQRLNAIDLAGNIRIIGDNILQRFVIPGNISAAYASRPDDERSYRQALTTFVNNSIRVAWQVQWFYFFGKLYQAAGDVPGLTPTAHLMGAISLYQEGLFWVDLDSNDTEPREEFRQAALALGRMQSCLEKSCLENDSGEPADPLWAEVSTNDSVAPFVAMAESGDAVLVQFWRENGLLRSQ